MIVRSRYTTEEFYRFSNPPPRFVGGYPRGRPPEKIDCGGLAGDWMAGGWGVGGLIAGFVGAGAEAGSCWL